MTLTNGAPTTDWSSTPLFSRLIYRGDNDMWSVLPCVFSSFDFDLPLLFMFMFMFICHIANREAPLKGEVSS